MTIRLQLACLPQLSRLAQTEDINICFLVSIPGLGRVPGEKNDYPLQYSGLENSMDRGAWQATVHRLAKSQRRLSDFPFHRAAEGGDPTG